MEISLSIIKILNLLSVLLLITSISIIANLRIVSLIRAYVFQGLALTLMTGLIAYGSNKEHIYLVAVATLIVKVFFIPIVLNRIIKRLSIVRDMEPFLSIPLSILCCGLLIVLAYFIAEPISSMGLNIVPGLLSISISLVLIGCFVMVIRKKAITQIIGLLTLENGIFLSALATTFGMPLIVEIGIFFDVLLGAIILGIFVYRIKETFEHLDTSRLKSLKG